MGKNILYFIVLVLAFYGIAGGIGWMCYVGSHIDGSGYAVAVGLAIACYLAYPKAREYAKRILEG